MSRSPQRLTIFFESKQANKSPPDKPPTCHCSHCSQTVHTRPQGYCARCALLMTRGTTSPAYSISVRVDSRPSEKRTSEFASFRSIPRPTITCDGSMDPAEHAEPLEAQMPSKSSPASSAILSEPSTRKET